jgi:hypothetical protein
MNHYKKLYTFLEQVKTERPGVHSVSHKNLEKWKKIKKKALTNPTIRAKMADLIRSRRERGKAEGDY